METDKTPVGSGTGSDGEELYPEATRSLDRLRETRLLVLLHDMVDAEDGAKAAEALGVSYRTVARTIDSGRLTARMTAALESHLLQGGGSAAARQRRRVAALENQLAALVEETRGGLKALAAEAETLREAHARSRRHFERRLVALESSRNGTEDSEAEGPGRRRSKAGYAPPRRYPQLVTEQAGDDEEGVYGEAAPVVVEWRAAREEFMELLKTGTELAQEEARMRMLRLEIAIIEDHELTLPPASYPWGPEDRRDEARRRRRRLGSAQADRNRALGRLWLRRILTFGIWRS